MRMTNRPSFVLSTLLASVLCLGASGCALDVEDDDETVAVEEENTVDEAGNEVPTDLVSVGVTTYTTCDFGAIYGDCTCSYSGSGGRGNVIEDDDIRGLYYELYSKWGSRVVQVQGRVRCTRGSDTYLKYGSWVTGRSRTSCPSGYTVSNSRCRVRVRH